MQLADVFGDRHTFRDAEFTRVVDNMVATFEVGEPRHAGKIGGKSLWLTWKPTASGVATFSTAGSSFDALLAAYTNDVLAALGQVVSDDDLGGFLTSEVQFNAVADTEYQIAVDGHAEARGTILLHCRPMPNAPPLPTITASPLGKVTIEGELVQRGVVSPTPGVGYRWFSNGEELAGEFQPTLAFVAASTRVGGAL